MKLLYKYIFLLLLKSNKTLKLFRYYSIDGSDKIVRIRKACPECGPGNISNIKYFNIKLIFK
jgi:ribosomal protein S27AE